MKLPRIMPIRTSVAACISLSLIWPAAGGGTALAIDWSLPSPMRVCQMPWLNETTDIYPFDCDGACGTICDYSPWTVRAAVPSADDRDPASQDDFDGCWEDDAARFGYADDDPGLAPDFDYGFPATHVEDADLDAATVSLAAPAHMDGEIAACFGLLHRPICQTVDIWINAFHVVNQLLNDQANSADVLVANITDLTDRSEKLSGQNVVSELNAENDGLDPSADRRESIVSVAGPSFDDLQIEDTSNGDVDESDCDFYCEYGYGCEYGYECEFEHESGGIGEPDCVEESLPSEQTVVVAVEPVESNCDAVQEFNHYEPVMEGPTRYVFLRTEASIAAANQSQLQQTAVAPAIGGACSVATSDDGHGECGTSNVADVDPVEGWQSYPEACLAELIVSDEYAGGACGIEGAASDDAEKSWPFTYDNQTGWHCTVEQPWPFTYDNLTGWHRTEDYPCIDPYWMAAEKTEIAVPEMPTVDLRPFLRPGLVLAAGLLEQLSRSLQLASDELRQVASDLDAPSGDEGAARSARHCPFDGTHIGL